MEGNSMRLNEGNKKKRKRKIASKSRRRRRKNSLQKNEKTFAKWIIQFYHIIANFLSHFPTCWDWMVCSVRTIERALHIDTHTILLVDILRITSLYCYCKRLITTTLFATLQYTTQTRTSNYSTNLRVKLHLLRAQNNMIQTHVQSHENSNRYTEQPCIVCVCEMVKNLFDVT